MIYIASPFLSLRQMETLEQLRRKLVSLCIGTKLEEAGVHTVTFQPLLSRVNQDRVVTESWDISGQTWLFLAVCDGHGGTSTAEYAARVLPGRIWAELSALLDRLDPDKDQNYQTLISALLLEEIEKFDRQIGEAVITLCKKPKKLTEGQAQELVQKHSEVLSRAYHGTTLTIALVNRSQDAMWLAGVGDSTVALSCTNADGTRGGKRLLDLHATTTPSEYFRVSMSHPAVEEDIFLQDRLLNSLSMTRAIGDFSFKFHRSYLTHLFSYLPSTASAHYIPGVTKYSRTPPYVIPTPSLCYVDLQPFRARNPILLLFTDGVDNLASGRFNAKAVPRKGDPSALVGALLGDNIGSDMAGILGHGIESKWHECDGNRAVEVLGNLLGGTDIERLSMTMDPAIISDADDAEFYIDDTSIIVCDIFKGTISS